jgi:hypothetical protein
MQIKVSLIEFHENMWKDLWDTCKNPGDTWYRSWLRYYATSREVASSIPDEVITFFNWPNPSSCTMAMGSIQPLTEMSTRNLPGGKGRPARGANNFTAISESTVYKMWEPRRLTTVWAFMDCYRDSFTFM